MEDNKDNNKSSLELQGIPKNISIFKDTGFAYLYDKVEKITTALYMITNFFATEEPVKWQIRETSLKLLSATMSLSTTTMSGRELTVRDISRNLFQVKSLLSVAYRSGFISSMNYEIVDSEFNNLAQYLNEYNSGQLSIESKLFDDSFFKTEVPKNQPVIKDNLKDSKYKGHQNKYNVLNKDTLVSSKPKVVRNTAQHSQRREKIMAIIKDKGEVSVKDISILVTDCSEKTLQRELLAMVSDGLLKKEGERRWSKYSINSK